MTTLYKRHDVTTIAEVNTLALSDNQENGSLVLGPCSETCSWILPYAIRNEPTTTGYWSYQDGYGGDQLRDGDSVTVLVPIEAEEVRVIESGGLERDYHGATELNRTPDCPRRDYRRTEFHTPWEATS